MHATLERDKLPELILHEEKQRTVASRTNFAHSGCIEWEIGDMVGTGSNFSWIKTGSGEKKVSRIRYSGLVPVVIRSAVCLARITT